MKISKLILIICSLALASCLSPLDRETVKISEANELLYEEIPYKVFSLQSPTSWSQSSNPLDLPDLEWHSPAWGTFGPGGHAYPYRPDAYGEHQFFKN